MKKMIMLTASMLLLSSLAIQAENESATQQIAKNGSQASVPGPEVYFTGQVRIEPLFSATDSMNATGAYVTFEPGSRSAWHTHPAGQMLVVTLGMGWTQVWGGPIEEIHPGDVVKCPPGVKHWHGASPTTAMTHISVAGDLNGTNVQWLEKVSDEQYKK